MNKSSQEKQKRQSVIFMFITFVTSCLKMKLDNFLRQNVSVNLKTI